MKLTIEAVDNGWVVTTHDDTPRREVVEIRNDTTEDEYQRHQVKALVNLLHLVTDWARLTDGPDILSKHNRFGVNIEMEDRGE